MKIVITESQYNKILNEHELKFRRIYKKIQEYFLRKMEDYIPCNYNYEDGVYDFFADVRGITIERFLDELYGIQWGDNDGNNEEFFDLHDALSDMLYETEFEYVKSYYNAWIKEHCPKEKN